MQKYGRGGYSLDDVRSNDLARTAPGSKGINDNEFVLFECGFEFFLAVKDTISLAFVLCPSHVHTHYPVFSNPKKKEDIIDTYFARL